jgi:SAM-dependent methyltransferase
MVDQRWDAFAAREPYFAVLTHPRYLRENFDAAAEAEFFDTGEAYVAELYDFLGPTFQPKSVLEFGCGVGRLAIPFAKRGAHVVAIDASPAMLATARRHAGSLTNIELATALDARQFDLVNCFLVLQRMRPSEGLVILRKLAQRVRDGGVGVFHVPYRASVSRGVAIARTLRSRVPGVNAAMNVARRKPASTPFIESNTYDLNDVMRILQESGFDAPRLVFTRHGDLEGVIVYAARRHRPGSSRAATAAVTDSAAEADAATPGGFIDVRKMIAETSIDDLNRTAEQYFSSLTDWEHHLAKPFNKAEDAPAMLINVATVMQGLQLVPGMTILEYGAGSGWLSRFFTQLGCKSILLDVSATALKIARELYQRMPVVGDRPAPEFLVYDGRRIELADASVDRIVCFDAFHHAPNPDDVLREFARVLAPGGIAAFAEPGPQHSKTAQSQYEMRNYGVVENDVDIHGLWRTARSAGFSDLKLAAFNVPPFHVSLDEFDELLAAGPSYARWAEATRAFLQNSRTFFLRKGGDEAIDSRRADALRCAIEVRVDFPNVHARVSNTGRGKWLPSADTFGGVSLGCHLYDAGGKLLDLDYHWQWLPRALAPGEEVELDFTLPPLPPGRYTFEFDCVANKVAWFSQVANGSHPARVTIVEV